MTKIIDFIESILMGLGKIPADKVMHFAGGTILFATFRFVFMLIGVGSMLPVYSLVAVCLMGILKEWPYDKFVVGHSVDKWDAIATVLGGIVGLLCGI